MIDDLGQDYAWRGLCAAVASVGLLDRTGREETTPGYKRQAVILDGGVALRDLSFGPWERDARADITEYAFYDAKGERVGHNLIDPARRPLMGDVLILPADTIAITR